VAAKHQVRLPEPPPRTPVVLPPWPEFVTWKPNCIGIWDGTEFRRARREAFAIVDVVSRRWIHTVLTAEASSTQVQLLFAQALESEGLMAKLTPRAPRPGRRRPEPAGAAGLVRQRSSDDVCLHP